VKSILAICYVILQVKHWHLPSRQTEDESDLLQPPRSRSPSSQVATHGRCITSFYYKQECAVDLFVVSGSHTSAIAKRYHKFV